MKVSTGTGERLEFSVSHDTDDQFVIHLQENYICGTTGADTSIKLSSLSIEMSEKETRTLLGCLASALAIEDHLATGD